MPYLSKTLQKRLEDKLSRLQKLRPLPKSAVRKIKEKLQIEMTYNSNAIEGNSLTLKETFLVINEGITVKGKSLKDHLEAQDHHSALHYLYDLVDKSKKQAFSERTIRTLHQLVLEKTDKDWAGTYRNSNVIIGGADHTPPDALDVPKEMQNLMKWLNREKNKTHVVELSAILHHKLVHIHPFFDGNGRTSRLTMNLLLMQAGYPLVIILKNDRKKYYHVLDKADKGDYEPMVRFIAQAVERSLDIYLKTLTPSSKIKEKFLPLATIAKSTPYSAKYLNLLSRQGKLEAHKDKRNWVTSKKAVERYMDRRKRKR